MEHFTQLKRRTTDLFQSLPQSLPKMPDLSSPIKARFDAHNTMKGTWERVSIPPLPRSSHSVDVIAGTAYVFGGEGAKVRQPVDNDMHAIILPTNTATADYYAIKAVAAAPSVPAVTVAEPPVESDVVAISEPTKIEADEAGEAGETDAAAAADKGKGKEEDVVEEIPLPGPALGDVPAPRVGHATAVIGNRIFLFGGRGGPAMTPLDERGRVWVFDTKTHTWSFLDPQVSPTATTASPVLFPAARSYHAGTSTDQPASLDDVQARPPRRAASWKEWAEGDMAEVGTPQRPIVGNVAARARDADSDGYGTFFVHGGCLIDGGRASDLWAFDVRTRVWRELPAAPGLPRGGTALCVSRSRLYRFGGFNGTAEEGGRLDFLDLALTSPDDTSAEPADVVVTARGGWQSLVPEIVAAPPQQHAREATAVGEADDDDEPQAVSVAAAASSPTSETEYQGATAVTAAAAAATAAAARDDSAATPLIPAAGAADLWPGNRSVASLEAVTMGGGWEYLVLALGERSPSGSGHEAAGRFWDDVWVFPVPSDHLSAASVSDAVSGAVSGAVRNVRSVLPQGWFGRGHSGSVSVAAAHSGQWLRLSMTPYDDDDADAEGGPENYTPGRRGWIAGAPLRDLEENAVLIIGGLNEENQRLGDAWILRLGGDKRE